MAHFAKISENLVVERVIVIPDSEEHRGNEYLNNDLKQQGRWIKCSYNSNIRKFFPGVGFIYSEKDDEFIPPQPHDSWTLDENNVWQAPKPRPDDIDKMWLWNEEEQEWYYEPEPEIPEIPDPGEQPFPSWILVDNEWQAPSPKPDTELEDGDEWIWFEPGRFWTQKSAEVNK